MFAVSIFVPLGQLDHAAMAVDNRVRQRFSLFLSPGDEELELEPRIPPAPQLYQQLRIAAANKQLVRMGIEVGGQVHAGAGPVLLLQIGGRQAQMIALQAGIGRQAAVVEGNGRLSLFPEVGCQARRLIGVRKRGPVQVKQAETDPATCGRHGGPREESNLPPLVIARKDVPELLKEAD